MKTLSPPPPDNDREASAKPRRAWSKSKFPCGYSHARRFFLGLVFALAALGGCGGATPDCGADETLDLVRGILLENTFMPAHKKKLAHDFGEAKYTAEFKQATEAERNAVWQAARDAAERQGIQGWDAVDAADAARDEWNRKHWAEIQAEREKMAGSAASPDEVWDLYNVQIAFVYMTKYDKAKDAYQCSARVTSNLLRDIKIIYAVRQNAADSDEFFVEVSLFPA